MSGNFGPTEPSWDNEPRDDYNNNPNDAYSSRQNKSAFAQFDPPKAGGAALYEDTATSQTSFLSGLARDIVDLAGKAYDAVYDYLTARSIKDTEQRVMLDAGARNFIDTDAGIEGKFSEGVSGSFYDGGVGEKVPGMYVGGPYGEAVVVPSK